MKQQKISTTINDFLNEQQSLKNEERYILLPCGDDIDDELYEEYDIDIYDAYNSAEQIAKDGGLNILSDKRLLDVQLDISKSCIIGGVWVSDNDEIFSFDIAIDSSYQNMGLSSMLIESAISEYESQKDMYDDMGKDFKMEVDVINPKLAQILEKKYGFFTITELSQNRVLMSV